MSNAPDPQDEPAATTDGAGTDEVDQILEDAEGGVEGSLLDAPED